MMKCQGCGKQSHQIHGYCNEYGQYCEVCTECANLSSSDASVPDVFWNGRPYYSEALEVEFTSRSQKARVMKEKGVTELGSQKLGQKSWVDGTRETRRKAFESQRPIIRETLKRWKETGRASPGFARGKVQ